MIIPAPDCSRRDQCTPKLPIRNRPLPRSSGCRNRNGNSIARTARTGTVPFAQTR